MPYILRGGERFFDRPEIREARLLLRGAARAASDGDPLVDEVRSVLASSGWDPERPPPGGAARERWESLAALLALAEETAAAHDVPALAAPTLPATGPAATGSGGHRRAAAPGSAATDRRPRRSVAVRAGPTPMGRRTGRRRWPTSSPSWTSARRRSTRPPCRA